MGCFSTFHLIGNVSAELCLHHTPAISKPHKNVAVYREMPKTYAPQKPLKVSTGETRQASAPYMLPMVVW